MQDNEPIPRVQYALLRLRCDKSIPMRYGHHLRGWLMERFPGQTLVSHHEDTKQSVYMYPRVQSKIIGGDAVILGIEEGVDFINEIATAPPQFLFLNQETFSVNNIQHKERLGEFGVTASEYQYRFVTPWLGLNQENYKRYAYIAAGRERQRFLSGILVGNVLSVAKSLGIVLNEQINTRSFLWPIPIRFKGKSMVGFSGNFRANLYILNYLGLGKSVSRGFGTVVRVEQK